MDVWCLFLFIVQEGHVLLTYINKKWGLIIFLTASDGAGAGNVDLMVCGTRMTKNNYMGTSIQAHM